MAVNFIGFDSAWAGSARAPGAICAFRVEAGEPKRFDVPRPVDFKAARDFILARHGDGDLTIVAIDQPTIVPNLGGARPAERVVASLMSFSGGGIQPAFRGKESMFGEGAPIWNFLTELGFTDDPEGASRATYGGFVLEVFPALALLSLDPAFLAGPRRGPRYNPSRATFRLDAWSAVRRAVISEARRLGLSAAASWCEAIDIEAKPRKLLQDSLDSLICLLVAARWVRARETCVMIGDLECGYIVAPSTIEVRARLARSAVVRDVPIA